MKNKKHAILLTNAQKRQEDSKNVKSRTEQIIQQRLTTEMNKNYTDFKVGGLKIRQVTKSRSTIENNIRPPSPNPAA